MLRFAVSLFAGVLCVIEFGVHLAELTVEPQGALAIRQVRSTQTVSGWEVGGGGGELRVYLATQ